MGETVLDDCSKSTEKNEKREERMPTIENFVSTFYSSSFACVSMCSIVVPFQDHSLIVICFF